MPKLFSPNKTTSGIFQKTFDDRSSKISRLIPIIKNKSNNL